MVAVVIHYIGSGTTAVVTEENTTVGTRIDSHCNKGSGSMSNTSYYSPKVLHTSTFRIYSMRNVLAKEVVALSY